MIASLDITDWVIRYLMDPCSTILYCMYKHILDMVLLCAFIAMDTFSHINMQFMVIRIIRKYCVIQSIFIIICLYIIQYQALYIQD